MFKQPLRRSTVIQTGQGKLNEGFFVNSEGKWALRTADSPISYKVLYEEVTKDISYIGYALPGTALNALSWRIQKVVTSGAITTTSWANGNDSFVNSWDLRATYTYS